MQLLNFRITSYNVCYTKLLRVVLLSGLPCAGAPLLSGLPDFDTEPPRSDLPGADAPLLSGLPGLAVELLSLRVDFGPVFLSGLPALLLSFLPVLCCLFIVFYNFCKDR